MPNLKYRNTNKPQLEYVATNVSQDDILNSAVFLGERGFELIEPEDVWCPYCQTMTTPMHINEHVKDFLHYEEKSLKLSTNLKQKRKKATLEELQRVYSETGDVKKTIETVYFDEDKVKKRRKTIRLTWYERAQITSLRYLRADFGLIKKIVDKEKYVLSRRPNWKVTLFLQFPSKTKSGVYDYPYPKTKTIQKKLKRIKIPSLVLGRYTEKKLSVFWVRAIWRRTAMRQAVNALKKILAHADVSLFKDTAVKRVRCTAVKRKKKFKSVSKIYS